MNNKTIIPALISSAFIAFQTQNMAFTNENGSNSVDTSKFEQMFLYALQGNIKAVMDYLDTVNIENLTEKQAKTRQIFYSRFKTNDEEYDFITKDSDVKDLMIIYNNYWRDVLLDNSSLSKKDTMLIISVTDFLKRHYSVIKDKSQEDLNENFSQYLADFLSTRGIFAATGKTGMFYDLLMHAKETEIIYDVTTPEDTLNVKVVFMEDVISNGWESFATISKYYPGGWATSDALYCIKGSYDLESENFKVSYLKHEGKHFADYKKFPRLGGADLEYRAKLVELSSANQNLYSIIKFFILNSKYDRQNPHGFANYCIIRDLSKLIFDKDMITGIDEWKTIPIETINKNAVTLLKKNTSELEKAGALTVTDYIR